MPPPSSSRVLSKRLISTSGFRLAPSHVEHGHCQRKQAVVPQNKSFKSLPNVNMPPIRSGLVLTKHPSITDRVSVYSANQGDSQEHISSLMNTIILLFHFPFFQIQHKHSWLYYWYRSPLQVSIFALITTKSFACRWLFYRSIADFALKSRPTRTSTDECRFSTEDGTANCNWKSGAMK